MRSTVARGSFALACSVAALAVGPGCSKPTADEHGAGAPSAEPGPAASPAVSAGTAAMPSASTAPVPSAARSAANAPLVPPSSGALHASASATASASAPVASVSSPAVTGSAAPEPVQYASTSAGGNHFTVAVAARTGCAVGAACAGTITLTASGGYHINDEYPYRFATDDGAGAEWLSADGKGFGKTTGDFKKTTATTADLGIRYRGKQAGNVRLTGTYKMSVCSEANCQVETVPLTVNVTFR